MTWWYHDAMAMDAGALAAEIGRIFRAARVAIGWSQDELSLRSGVAQSKISRLERGLHSGVGFDELERLGHALGGRVRVELQAPFLADRERQRDLVHARSLGFVAARLARATWAAETEVEIHGSFGPGWIDVLAWHPGSSTLLVIEFKTELHDLGRTQRTLGWYEHGASDVARTRGWRPRRVIGALLVLDTAVVHDALRRNRTLVDQAFPIRAAALAGILAEPTTLGRGGRALAAVDPLSRRADWIRSTPLDGRRTQPAYRDYADIGRLLGLGTARPPRH